MKRQVKQFGQFINENFSRDNRVTIVDLLDCYIRENHPTGTVLVLIDMDDARDLVDGGIEVKVDPTEREIGEAQYDGTRYAELYENGVKVGEEDFVARDKEPGEWYGTGEY